MNEIVTTLRIYNLEDASKNKLKLRLGRDEEVFANRRKGNPDYGFRWSFIGTKIPMPVRKGTWFNGFPEETMVMWLAEQGWHVRTVVDPVTCKADVYEVPNDNEEDGEAIELFDVSDIPTCGGLENGIIEEAVRILYRCNRRLTAVKLFRYVYKCGLRDAKEAVESICT